MIKDFQLFIHQVLDSVELNEKTFRDLGSEFVIGGIRYVKIFLKCASIVPKKNFIK